MRPIMPTQNEKTNTVDTLSISQKLKCGRYSLKKLLDRSHFSPRLLRLNRVAKSHAGTKGTGDTIVKLQDYSNPSPPNSATPDDTICHTSQRSAALTLAESSLPVFTDNDDVREQNLLEEEYEESLSHFADLIIEGLRADKSHDFHPIVRSLCQSIGSASGMVPSARLASHSPCLLNLSSGASSGCPKGCRTSSVDLSITKQTGSSSLERLNSCRIYNEPCDAKPIGTNGPDEVVTIYTSTNHRHSTSGRDNQLMTVNGVSKSSPASGLSSMFERDAECGVTKQLDAEFRLEDWVTNKRISGCASLQSTEATADRVSLGADQQLSTVAEGRNTNMPIQSPQYSQQNPGFVDAPRGNSVIVHHPTSPFARVPRAASPHEGSIGYVESRVSELVCRNTSNSPDITTYSTNALSSQSTTTYQRPTGSEISSHTPAASETPQTTGSRTSSTQVDTHPTYEEAWDVKMTRQLGFGIPHLTPNVGTKNGLTTQTSALSESVSPFGGKSSERSSPAGLRSSSERPVYRITGSKKERNSSNKTMCPGATCGHSTGLKKTGILFHENPAFEGKSSEAYAQPDKGEESKQSVEYDYAYNGSWSMGVQMSMRMAINSSSCDQTPVTFTQTSCSSTPSNIGPALCCTKAPLHPAHQVQRVSGVNLAGTHVLTKHGLLDSDNLSTDSCDESWDTRHNRVISELTNFRLMDPATVLPSSTVTTTTVASATPVTSPHRSPQRTNVDLLQPYSSQSSKTTTKLSPRFGVRPISGPLAMNLEVLPLEEQPWYHPCLTRAEAEEMLATEPEGSFLVRNSETSLKDYSLTIKHKIFLHMKISRNVCGQYILGEYSQPYTSVPQMIYHYARTLVPVRGAEFVTLTHPICRQAV